MECQLSVRGMPAHMYVECLRNVLGMPCIRGVSECEVWESVRGMPYLIDHVGCTRNANRYALSLRIRLLAASSCSIVSGVWSTQMPCGTSLMRTDGQSVARMVIACRA